MITKNLKNFNLRQIADSGQCFRMIPCAPNDPQTAYRVISGGHFLIVDQNRDEVIFHCPNDEFAFWDHYFDLGIMVLISALLTLRMNIFQKRRLSAVEYGS